MEDRNAEGRQKSRPSVKDLRSVRATVCLAEEMGEGLGRGAVLFGPVPGQSEDGGEGLNASCIPHPDALTSLRTRRGACMSDRVMRAGLQVEAVLADFIEGSALPGTGIAPGAFWQGFAALIADLGPVNRRLLAVRDEMQAAIDAWHIARRGKPFDPVGYEAFLREIGYIVPEGPDFTIETTGTDPEIATVPGPQLVVPVMNARYALNAANARWGSLYDALYGTDALGDAPWGKGLRSGARGAGGRLGEGVSGRGGAAGRGRLGRCHGLRRGRAERCTLGAADAGRSDAVRRLPGAGRMRRPI